MCKAKATSYLAKDPSYAYSAKISKQLMEVTVQSALVDDRY